MQSFGLVLLLRRAAGTREQQDIRCAVRAVLGPAQLLDIRRSHQRLRQLRLGYIISVHLRERCVHQQQLLPALRAQPRHHQPTTDQHRAVVAYRGQNVHNFQLKHIH